MKTQDKRQFIEQMEVSEVFVVLTDRCQKHTHMSHMYKQYVFHTVRKYFELAADYVAWIYWRYDVSVQYLVRTSKNMKWFKKNK